MSFVSISSIQYVYTDLWKILKIQKLGKIGAHSNGFWLARAQVVRACKKILRKFDTLHGNLTRAKYLPITLNSHREKGGRRSGTRIRITWKKRFHDIFEFYISKNNFFLLKTINVSTTARYQLFQRCYFKFHDCWNYALHDIFNFL